MLVGSVATLLLSTLAGCHVPQPRGLGKLERVREPSTRRHYWLYLPHEYVSSDEGARRARRWPVVVTYHGMKPFDGAHAQALEWEQEADRYGYIVVAPELRAPDVLDQFPVRTVHPAFKSDEVASVAILEHLFATSHADPGNVLATSFSSGGYMAHYMMNRHPQLFSCLAVRQSNYSGKIMDSGLANTTRNHPILIINTQNDLGICKKESKEAVRFYETTGHTNVNWVYIKDLGHERTPDLAADFFGHAADVQPNRPPGVLVRRQALSGNPSGLAFLARGSSPRTASTGYARPGTQRSTTRRPSSNSRPPSTRTTSARGTTPRRPTPQHRANPGKGRVPQTRAVVQTLPTRTRQPMMSAPSGTVTPPRHSGPPKVAGVPTEAVNINVSSRIGLVPFHLGFNADCPKDWHRSADFLWMLDGETIANGVNGQKTILDPGDHQLSLLVVTDDGREYRAASRIRVLPRPDDSSYTRGK